MVAQLLSLGGKSTHCSRWPEIHGSQSPQDKSMTISPVPPHASHWICSASHGRDEHTCFAYHPLPSQHSHCRLTRRWSATPVGAGWLSARIAGFLISLVGRGSAFYVRHRGHAFDLSPEMAAAFSRVSHAKATTFYDGVQFAFELAAEVRVYIEHRADAMFSQNFSRVGSWCFVFSFHIFIWLSAEGF